MYAFTLHYDYHCTALNDSLPPETKQIDAVDERQATAMATLEIQTMAPLSKVVQSQIHTYTPRMVKIGLPSNYPPVVTALEKTLEFDPVVEELKKQAREIYLNKYGYLPGDNKKELPSKKTETFPTKSEKLFHHKGQLYIGYLFFDELKAEFIQFHLFDFDITSSQRIGYDAEINPTGLMRQLMKSGETPPTQLYEMIYTALQDEIGSEAAAEFINSYEDYDFYREIAIHDLAETDMRSIMSQAYYYGEHVTPFHFFLRDVRSEVIDSYQQKAN